MVTRSREDYDALIKSVEETLSRPRPAEGSSWTTTPLPTKQPDQNADILDVMAKGFGEALGQTTKVLLDQIGLLKVRIEKLEKQHEQE